MSAQILQKKKWLSERNKLNNNYGFSPDWNEIINSLEVRILDYYFTPIEKILEPNLLKGEGFAILTLECALIEMFAAFKVGKIYNHNKSINGGLDYEYKLANQCFISFLQAESIFENNFYLYDLKSNRKDITKPYNAREFYNNVRCGLMHEAKTKGVWMINAKRKYTGHEKVFLSTKNGSISVDRTILFKLLKQYFNGYLLELKDDSRKGNKLRRFLGRKLDHLFDIPRDITFHWWIDS